MLTTGEDSGTKFAGGAANDTYTAGVAQDGAGNLKNTLQSIDSLDGGAGTDTLNATLNDAAVVAPVLKNIENVNVRLTDAKAGIDLSSAEGVTNLNVNNSSSAGGTNVLAGATGLSITNQKVNVTADKSTATTLALNFNAAGVVSDTAPTVVTLDLGATTASKATTMNITTNNSNVTMDSTQADIATTLTVAATGSNVLNLVDLGGVATKVTVTGAGSVDMTGTALTKVATFTAADGGVKANMTGNTATTLAVTTGAGADTLTATGANLTSLASGAGNDTITITTALAATSTVDAGAGDDTVTLNAAPTAGATIGGGEGTDVIGLAKADFATVAAFSAANLAKITGFEGVKFTNALANTDSYDVSKFTTGASVEVAAGVTSGTATVTNLAANSKVTISGNNTAVAQVVTNTLTLFTGTAAATDTYSMTINGTKVTTAASAYANVTDIAAALKTAIEANATTNALVSVSVAAGVVTLTAKTAGTALTVTASGNEDGADASVTATVATTAANVVAGTLAASMKTDTSADVMTVVLNNNYNENNDATATVTSLTNTVDVSNVETLNVVSSGKASAVFAGAAGNKADGVNNTLVVTDNQLVTLAVTGNQAFTFNTADAQTKLATIDASALTAGATISAAATTTATNAAITMKGSATEANTLTGSANADTIVGGAKADTITGGGKGDTMTGNGGNDKFVLGAGDSILGTGTFDTITDFVANTYGQGTNGAVTAAGAVADATKLTGDTISFAKTGTGADGVKVGVFTNAADASTFLANNKGTNNSVAALDSSTGALYIDNVGADGVADIYIKLTGVTTIDAAAFVLV